MDATPLTPETRAAIAARLEDLRLGLAGHEGALPPRAEALALLRERVSSPSLRGHMLAVEATMRAYAGETGADPEVYGLTGMLHDVDYEAHPVPAEHPMVGCGWLLERGYPAELVEAVLGHASYTGVPRTSGLARTLYAVDELTGFLTAVAYVRPSGLEGLTFKSFNKKFKTASFAAGVSRDEVVQGAAELGVELAEHVLFLARALMLAFPNFPEIPEAA